MRFGSLNRIPTAARARGVFPFPPGPFVLLDVVELSSERRVFGWLPLGQSNVIARARVLHACVRENGKTTLRKLMTL